MSKPKPKFRCKYPKTPANGATMGQVLRVLARLHSWFQVDESDQLSDDQTEDVLHEVRAILGLHDDA